MNRQSKASRWLKVLETSQNMTNSILRSYGAHGAAGKPMPGQAQELLVIHSSDPINLIAEADPPVVGTSLAAQLFDVIEAAEQLKSGPSFDADMTVLSAALQVVLPNLRTTVEDDVETVGDLIAELERTFMVSLFISMSAHFPTTQRVVDWEKAHHGFLAGKRRRDVGHYFTFRADVPPGTSQMQAAMIPEVDRFFTTTPGSGRIHMQHLVSAINSGVNMVIAGGGSSETDYYPEAQSISYAQWFTYMHAIWDEQFRPRFAAFFNQSLSADAALAKNDITSDFFGDIRLLRNDFVHHHGVATNAAKSKLKALPWTFTRGDRLEIRMEQMIDLMELFPRTQLAVVPTTQAKKRGALPGSVDIDLIARLKDVLEADKTLDRNDVNDKLVLEWLDQRTR